MDSLDHQTDEQVVLEQIKPETSLQANDKIEVVLLWAHHEKTVFFGKDNDAWKNRKR